MEYDPNGYYNQEEWRGITLDDYLNLGISARTWCEEHDSRGKFYCIRIDGFTSWHFEKEEDAIVFALKFK